MRIPQFVREFQDFINCREETKESLFKRYGISPKDGDKCYPIYFGSLSNNYFKDDIRYVLDQWLGVGKNVADIIPKCKPHVYGILWKSLKKTCRH